MTSSSQPVRVSFSPPNPTSIPISSRPMKPKFHHPGVPEARHPAGKIPQTTASFSGPVLPLLSRISRSGIAAGCVFEGQRVRRCPDHTVHRIEAPLIGPSANPWAALYMNLLSVPPWWMAAVPMQDAVRVVIGSFAVGRPGHIPQALLAEATPSFFHPGRTDDRSGLASIGNQSNSDHGIRSSKRGVH